jgi:23S rRNA pseudouridine1911/1915/1917 synthase
MYSPVSERILYEDNHLIVVNKLPSEIVQGDKTGDTPLSEDLKIYLKEKYNKPGNVFVGVVHRLDRPTSGVVMFAKTSKALSRLTVMMREREVKKTYWAIVKNTPKFPQGTLTHYLVRNPVRNRSTAGFAPVPGAKQAIMDYKTIAKSKDYYLLEVDLKTGRHHQIRSQLSAINCPIKGDLKYGFPRSNPGASISLHARYLSFTHPVSKEEINITANPPTDPLWDYFLSLEVCQVKNEK